MIIGCAIHSKSMIPVAIIDIVLLLKPYHNMIVSACTSYKCCLSKNRKRWLAQIHNYVLLCLHGYRNRSSYLFKKNKLTLISLFPSCLLNIAGVQCFKNRTSFFQLAENSPDLHFCVNQMMLPPKLDPYGYHLPSTVPFPHKKKEKEKKSRENYTSCFSLCQDMLTQTWTSLEEKPKWSRSSSQSRTHIKPHLTHPQNLFVV